MPGTLLATLILIEYLRVRRKLALDGLVPVWLALAALAARRAR